jgi:Putative peptidoglycan binding domain
MAEPLLRTGSRGEDVRRVQRALASVGFDPVQIDGIFGPNTERAVKAFQADRGLDADGIVGPLTRGALPKSVVRLHVKILVTPTSLSVDDMIRNMRSVYISVRVGVEVASTETLGSAPLLEDLDVGPCTVGSSTSEQTALFANRNNVGANEVVAYFVRTVSTSGVPHPGALNGCASHPAGQPGVAVSSTPSPWTLGHEVGHVLGLPHADTAGACLFDRLMTGCSTNRITNPPPDLDATEAATMDASPLTIDL